jgi:hypothetical protein
MVDIAKKDKLLDSVVQRSVDLDDLVEELGPSYRARMSELLTNPAQRDRELWNRLLTDSGLDPTKWAAMTLQQLNQMPTGQRGLRWREAQAVIAALARKQAELEILSIPVLKLAWKGSEESAKQSIKLDQQTARAAATEGTKEKIKAEKAKRKEQRDNSQNTDVEQ